MPFNEDADPHLWLENLEDPKVIEWATARDAEARRTLAPISKKTQIPHPNILRHTPGHLHRGFEKRGLRPPEGGGSIQGQAHS